MLLLMEDSALITTPQLRTQHQCDVSGPLQMNKPQGLAPSPKSAQHLEEELLGLILSVPGDERETAGVASHNHSVGGFVRMRH